MSPTPPRAVATGHPRTCLIIVRGNSGSGKSSIARAVRDRHGRGCALVEQDYLRRTLLKERDLDGGNAAALIDQTVRFALDVGHHVICEGILHSPRYGAMLTDLIRDHRGSTAVFYLDVPFEETLRRHAGRPQATRFTAEDMHGWYVAHEVLGVPGEHILGEDVTFDDAVDQIARHLPRGDDHAPPSHQNAPPPAGPPEEAQPPTTAPSAASDAARRAYNRSLPRKRAAAAVLFTDNHDRVLIVKPTYKPGWELPGGAVEDNESPYEAAVREIAEELGLDRPGALLVLDYVATTPERSDGLMLTAAHCPTTPRFACLPTSFPRTPSFTPTSSPTICPPTSAAAPSPPWTPDATTEPPTSTAASPPRRAPPNRALDRPRLPSDRPGLDGDPRWPA